MFIFKRVSGWWKLINRLKVTPFKESLKDSGLNRYLKLSKVKDGTVAIVTPRYYLFLF